MFRPHEDLVIAYAGLIAAPKDLHVTPDVRVAFARFAGPVSAAYNDDNAVIMHFVDADTGERKAGRSCVAARVRVEVAGAAGEEAPSWTELLPWTDDVVEEGGCGSEYLIMLGRTYRVLSLDEASLWMPLFELHPPYPCRELIRVAARQARSYCPRVHRMLLGDE